MKKTVAVFFAATLMANIIAALPTSAAETVINIEESAYLSDTAGQITIQTNGSRNVHVTITKDTLDGAILYYDTCLESDGAYCFALDSCEFDINTKAYVSSFTVTVCDEADPACSYTETGLTVLDPGFSLGVTNSEFVWNIILTESETRDVTASVSDAQITNSVWSGASEIAINYIDLTLGDVDGVGTVSIQDSFSVLLYYASHAAGLPYQFTDQISSQSEDAAFSAADVDRDLNISIKDAFKILTYYAQQNAGLAPSWD